MKIKVKSIDSPFDLCQHEKGEWVDLKTRDNLKLKGPSSFHQKVTSYPELIPLGIAMQLPKYFEANILPRSSTFPKYGIMMANSMGVIDHTYHGDEDEWLFSAIPFRDTVIEKGTRIAQFRIRPSQFAPWWIKLKWLFTSKIKFIEVSSLGNENRGGFGSTGK
jgi:dUTP pyrophosphatase